MCEFVLGFLEMVDGCCNKGLLCCGGDEKSTISHAFYVNFEDWIKVSLLKIDVQPLKKNQSGEQYKKSFGIGL